MNQILKLAFRTFDFYAFRRGRSKSLSPDSRHLERHFVRIRAFVCASEGKGPCNLELPANPLQHLFPTENTGEGGIRTLGTLLRYSALAKRRFRPLSHLTWICGGNAISAEHGASIETFGRQLAGQGVHGVRSPATRLSLRIAKGRSKTRS